MYMEGPYLELRLLSEKSALGILGHCRPVCIRSRDHVRAGLGIAGLQVWRAVLLLDVHFQLG